MINCHIKIRKLFNNGNFKPFPSLALQQLMNEAEYLMKNYGDRGGFYPSRQITAPRDLHNSPYNTKAEFNDCFIIHSK